MVAVMVLGVVWHFWIAPLLVIGSLIILIATFVGYLKKVSAPRYPKR